MRTTQDELDGITGLSCDVYLNCSRCGFSLSTSRFAHLEPEYCPRCLARGRVLQPLFRSPLTVRDLRAGAQDDSPGSASENAPIADPDAA